MMDGKSEELVLLVNSLDLDSRGWVLLDHWKADTEAFGIAHQREPRHLVYVGIVDDGYYFACEAPSGPEATDFVVVAEGEVGSKQQLIEIIESHLG